MFLTSTIKNKQQYAIVYIIYRHYRTRTLSCNGKLFHPEQQRLSVTVASCLGPAITHMLQLLDLLQWWEIDVVYSLGTILFTYLHFSTDNDKGWYCYTVILFLLLLLLLLLFVGGVCDDDDDGDDQTAKVNADSILYLLPGPSIWRLHLLGDLWPQSEL